MAKPVAIREVRLAFPGTTFNTSFTSGNAAGWGTSNAVMLRVQSWDASGLVYENQPDGTLQTRLHGAPYNIPTLRKGTAKFKTYLEGANATAVANPVAQALSHVMGGTVQVPTTRTLTLSTGSNATHLNFTTSHGLSNGMALLVGSKGDGAGAGEVRSILSTVNANTVVLSMALSGAPSAASTAVASTTVFLDEDQAQTYLDVMAIGQETQDVIQGIGGAAKAKITGTAIGELPSVEFELMVSDWRTQEGVSLSTTTVPQGNPPSVDRGLGGFYINDACSGLNPVTRAVMKVGEIDIDPGMVIEALPDPNGVNGIGGWVRMPSSPKLKFKAILSERMPGFYNDWSTPTAKQCLVQFGHTATKCAAVEFQRMWLDQAPVRSALSNLAAVEVNAHGDEGTANTGGDLERSSIRIHFF